MNAEQGSLATAYIFGDGGGWVGRRVGGRVPGRVCKAEAETTVPVALHLNASTGRRLLLLRPAMCTAWLSNESSWRTPNPTESLRPATMLTQRCAGVGCEVRCQLVIV